MTKRSEASIISEIVDVYGRLSPENLSCDGELSRSETKRRYTILNKRLNSLFKELGREIDELEAYNLYDALPKLTQEQITEEVRQNLIKGALNV